jgi:GAF domain-containing protein
VATGTFVHIRDLAKDQSYAKRNPPTVAAVEIAGVRTTLAVPMFKDNELMGSLTVGRTEVRPFTAKQIELVQNFAAKAVIAIENARLVQELQESLEQQTAVSDVLQVITGSPGNLQPVFDAVLENARRLCDAEFGNIYRWDGDALHLLAWRNTPLAFAEYRKRAPFRPGPTSQIGRMLKTKSVVHVADAAANRDYIERTDPSLVAAIELGGVRTYVAVPMLKEGELIGAFTLFRQDVRPFTDRQIALITNFAHQVSIAIENARLVHELRESLQQQAAAADVLNVISRSTFDLQTVLDRLVELVTKLCDADLAAIHRQQGMNYRAIAICGGPPNFREIQNSVPLEPGRGTVIGRAVLDRKPVHVADVLADPDYLLKEAQDRLGYRTVLGVPLMREGKPIGVIALLRLTVRPFTEKQIKLVESFADQAVIAIENTRLFSELRQRTDDLGRSVAELQRERNNKLMNLEAMAASISHEVRQPLASIATHGGAALRFLEHMPPNVEEVRSALNWMISDSRRASQVFDNIRALFGKAERSGRSGRSRDCSRRQAIGGFAENYRSQRPVRGGPHQSGPQRN